MLHCWHCSWSTMVDLLPAWQALLSSLLGLTPSYRFTLPCYSKCLWSLLLKWLVLHGVVSWPAWDFYTLHRHQRTWNSCICHIAMDCAWKKKIITSLCSLIIRLLKASINKATSLRLCKRPLLRHLNVLAICYDLIVTFQVWTTSFRTPLHAFFCQAPFPFFLRFYQTTSLGRHPSLPSHMFNGSWSFLLQPTVTSS